MSLGTLIARFKLWDGTNQASVTAANALKVDASGVAVPVTDNAGTLTVDAPVGTPVAVRPSDGTAFIDPRGTTAAPQHGSIVVGGADIDPRDVSDRAARLLGHVTVDTAPTTAVTGPLTDAQLRATAVPVSQATAANLNAQIVGVVATDAPVSGNPLLTGGRASTAIPTAMSADGDLVPIWLDRSGAQIVRTRSVASYAASFRLAVAASALSLTFTPVANTDKQLLTIYHAVGATKTVRIRRISVLLSTGAIGVYGFEVRRLSGATAPATGVPAITPAPYDSSDSSAEVTCLAIPTTQGTETGVNLPLTPHLEYNATTATPEGNPAGLSGREFVLFESRTQNELKPLTIRAGVAEGFAVIGRSTTTAAIKWTAHIDFTEE